MDIQTLTTFFMWCTILNGSLLILIAIIFLVAPDLIYRKHKMWFAISRDQFNLASYCFLGLFKIFFIVFNLVPYVALLITA